MRRLSLLIVVAALCASAAPSVRADNSRARRAILEQVIPEIKFNGAAFKDCLEFLRDVTNANITVNWRAVEAAGVSQDAPISMRVRQVTLRKALQMICAEASGGDTLSFDMSEGVIRIATRELTDKQMITRIYPVEDLLVDIPDFSNPPDLSLQATSTGGSRGGGGGSGGSRGGGGAGGGAGANLFGGGNAGANGSGAVPDEKSMTRQERAEALVALIRDTVSPEIWKENGGSASIRYYGGKLIVTAPRSVQEAIGGDLD